VVGDLIDDNSRLRGTNPKTVGGAVISAVLMLTGFMLLSLVSASLASLFVREDEKPSQQRDEAVDQQILGTLNSVLERLESLESRALDNDSLRRATDRPDAV
jgi:membrane protein implicated in regulation of membrane protease activity